MQHVDPVYNYIDQEIEKAKNDLLFSEDRIQIHAALNYLLRLTVENKMKLVDQKLQNRMQAILLSSQANSAVKNQAQALSNSLVVHASWFNGAIRQAEDPVGIYNEWLGRLKAERDFPLFWVLIEDDAQIPSPPSVFEA